MNAGPTPAPAEPRQGAASAGLDGEAEQLAGYILGPRRAPCEAAEALEVTARYAAACRVLFTAGASSEDLAVLEFVKRRPWALPFLDAAAALTRSRSLLRKKLLLMLSILETMPGNADLFAPRPRPRWRVVGRLAVLGLVGLFKTALGLLIQPIASRSR